jgi:membrane protease YdiL (CAAX protease family)
MAETASAHQEERNSGIIRRHPLAAYFVLAFGLAWWPWPFTLLNPAGTAIIPWSPIVAAFIVAAVAVGRPGVKGLASSMVRWRVPPKWYAVALIMPPVLVAASVYGAVLFSAPIPSASQLGEWYLSIPTFFTTLIVAGPLTEEPGWRGFALPRMQERHSALAASLTLGVIWAAWHLPLLLTDETGQRPVVQYFMLLTAQSVLFTWLFNNTRGSVFLAILLHTMFNTAGAFFFKMYIDTDHYQQLWWIYAGLVSLVALVVVLLAGPRFLTREPGPELMEGVGRT